MTENPRQSHHVRLSILRRAEYTPRTLHHEDLSHRFAWECDIT
jgi:hypothetical protein